MQPFQICIGPIIRIGRESWCLPYAGFLYSEIQSSKLTCILLVEFIRLWSNVGVFWNTVPIGFHVVVMKTCCYLKHCCLVGLFSWKCTGHTSSSSICFVVIEHSFSNLTFNKKIQTKNICIPSKIGYICIILQKKRICTKKKCILLFYGSVAE